MPATSVRVDEAVKRELDKLQGVLQAETGARVSQSELLARLVAFARRHEREFLEREDAWTPPDRERMRKLFARVQDWGVETDVAHVDDALYGGGSA